ncbi:MAG: acyl carrier protein [Desulfobacterales bacterium]|nr:acyl carrier protein [Desulfobacterales bacterium]MCP4160426.1 acyl carrier protein [Deltaproteobacteria bacterium]
MEISVELQEKIVVKTNEIMRDLFELSPDELKPESRLYEDLDLDSLDAIDLIIAFQKEFGFKPENEEVQGIRTMKDVYEMVYLYHEKR